MKQLDFKFADQFKVGDFVKHKNIPNERLRVFKVGDGVLVIDRLDEEKIWYGGRQVMDYKKYICSIENISHDK